MLARGPALAIAHEAALKLKETCYVHAEALSSAEILHGPFAVLADGFPVLGFALEDEGGEDTRALAELVTKAGARAMIASSGPVSAGLRLPLLRPCIRCSIRLWRSLRSIRSPKCWRGGAASIRTGRAICGR